MAEKDFRQVSCPDDEALLAFRNGDLSGEEYETVALHLLLCNDCMESLNSLPWDEAQGSEEMTDEDQPETQVHLTPSLSRAIRLFRERHQQNADGLRGAPTDIKQEEIRPRQIWRTKSEGIVVPSSGGQEYYSVTELSSRPHLVVVTRAEINDPPPTTDYHTILVAPVDVDTEYKGEGDLLINQDDSPLGYAFNVQLWNEQPMLRENLECCLGELLPERYDELLAALGAHRGEESPHDSYSLEAVIMKGLHHDPIMRYRAKEYEDTAYLRMPVRSLIEEQDYAQRADVTSFPEPVWLAEGATQGEGDAVSEIPARKVDDLFDDEPDWLLEDEKNAATVPPGHFEKHAAGREDVETPHPDFSKLPPWLYLPANPAGSSIYLSAQQEDQGEWPVELLVKAEGKADTIRLTFDCHLSFLVVEFPGTSAEAAGLRLDLVAIGRELHLRPGGKAIIGTLEQFELSEKSSREQTVAALLRAGLVRPHLEESS